MVTVAVVANTVVAAAVQEALVLMHPVHQQAVLVALAHLVLFLALPLLMLAVAAVAEILLEAQEAQAVVVMVAM
jgi:hypothetical protein